MINRIGLTIVTYSDRSSLCTKIINECLNQGIVYINLYANQCHETSIENLKVFSKINKINFYNIKKTQPLTILFEKSLKEFKKNKQIDYFMILDDDNLPEKNCFKNLLDIKDQLFKNKNKFILYCTRHNFYNLDNLCLTTSWKKQYPENSFIGFDFFYILKTSYLSKFIRRAPKKYSYTNFGPWGGMFFDIKALDSIKFHYKNFVIYADDIFFTLKMNNLRFTQVVVGSANINDLTQSNVIQNNYFLSKLKKRSLYFRFRNHYYLSNLIKKNPFKYNLNKFFFYISFYIKFLIGTIFNFKKTKIRLLIFKLALRNSKLL